MGRTNILTTRSGAKIRNPIIKTLPPLEADPTSFVQQKKALQSSPKIMDLKPAIKKYDHEVQLILSSSQVLQSLQKNGTLTLKLKIADSDKPAVLTTSALKDHEKAQAQRKTIEFSTDISSSAKSDLSDSKRVDPILRESQLDFVPGWRNTRSFDRKLRRRF